MQRCEGLCVWLRGDAAADQDQRARLLEIDGAPARSAQDTALGRVQGAFRDSVASIFATKPELVDGVSSVTVRRIQGA